ncbi:MAG: di-heme-cytochrome C peroxidase [Pseudomonadota bacterium]
MNNRHRLRIRNTVAAASALMLMGFDFLTPPELPDLKQPDSYTYVQKSWDAATRTKFYRTHQGTATLPVPYEWLKHLEQPGPGDETKGKMLIDRDYLSRFGFLWDEAGSADQLPVGFALLENALNPGSKTPMFPDTFDKGKALTAVGFTCAACHTGQLNFEKDGKIIGVRVEGGPAMTDLGKFRKAAGLALIYTLIDGEKRDRFQQALIKDLDPVESRFWDFGGWFKDLQVLKRKLRVDVSLIKVLGASVKEALAQRSAAKGNVEEGFGRLDAINRIGNTVFGVQLNKDNFAPNNAPVSYPHIWHTSWFDWVQYNGSIMQPMVRNAGEALGVGARVNLRNKENQFASSAAIEHLHELELMLAGTKTFGGLGAPKWPGDVFGPIDTDLAERGKGLFQSHCMECHGPPVSELMKDPDNPAYKNWWNEIDGNRYFRVKLVQQRIIGTDPGMSAGMLARNVSIVSPKGVKLDFSGAKDAFQGCDSPFTGWDNDKQPFGFALALVVQSVVTKWYDENNVPPEKRKMMNGNRPNCILAGVPPWPLEDVKPVYKARPLDGIWATAPFLHNGSIPNLYLMMADNEERNSAANNNGVFYVGNRTFDPVKVGLSTQPAEGLSRFEPGGTGNSNHGHQFRGTEQDDPKNYPLTVIGPRIEPDDRMAIIEYLKSL